MRGNIGYHRRPIILLFWRIPPPPLDFRLMPGTTLRGWLDPAVCLLGLLGAIWSRRTLGRNWSTAVVFKLNHELVVNPFIL